MKKTIQNALLAAQVVILVACGNAQSIKGSGKIITETRAVQGFEQMEVNGVFNVILVQGDKEMVLIEGDDNIVPLITTLVSGNLLKIDMKKHSDIGNTKKMNVTITAKTLHKIAYNGVGSLSTTGTFKSDKLELNYTGVGNMKMTLDCGELTTHSTGVGSITIEGKATAASLKNEGVGSMDAKGLSVEVLHVDNSGVGNVTVNATKEAYLDNSGVGNVHLSGSAAVKHMESSGVGKVSVN